MHRIFFIICLLLILIIPQFIHSQGFRELEHKDTLTSHNNIDVTIFRAINDSRNGLLNSIIPITDKSVLPLSVALPVGIIGISRLNNNYYDENSGVLLLFSEIMSGGITFGLKQIFRRERPFVTLKDVHYNKYNSPTDRFSFPSGHTATSFSMATSLTLRYPDKPLIIVISYLYAAITGYGRMYLGVHYPSDVLGGMIIGSGSAALIYSLRKEIIDFKNSMFKEEHRPDSNLSNDMSATAILGLTVGVDILNNIIQHTFFRNNLNLSSSPNHLTAAISF